MYFCTSAPLTILPFASNRELRTFYHVCLGFKRKRLPLKRANLNLPIKQFLLRNKHVCKPRLQCFKNVTQYFVSVCRCFVLDCWYLTDLLFEMSVQIKVLYGPNYDRCKKSTISERRFKELNLQSLSGVVREIVGTFYEAAKTLRVQYRDDKGTFVTVTNEQDIQDAINSCQPLQVPKGDINITRICLRVDDACTPVEIEKSSLTLQPPKKRPRPCAAYKCLSFDDDLEEEEMRQEFSEDNVSCSDLTPYQRYRKKIDDDIEQKRYALLAIERKEQEVQRKLLRVKSNPSDGNMCRNCHMRLGHTARNCDYEKCISVFRCGEEKLHSGEIDSRGNRVTIQKLKADIAKLERDRDLKELASKKLSESLPKQVEISLLQENANLYMVNGNKNWSLLRKHVFIIEKYCKDHFSGKIPAKHNISDILSVALEGTSSMGDPTQSAVEQTRVK